MEEDKSSVRSGFFHSIVFKNILLFLFILMVAVVPLAFTSLPDGAKAFLQERRDAALDT